MGAIVVPWGSGGWKGIQVAHGAVPGFEAPAFDDSAWPEVALPIGHLPVPDTVHCPMQDLFPFQTSWDMGTDFLLRRTIIGGADLTVSYAIDNYAWIYVDGGFLDYGENAEPGNDFCPARDDHLPATGVLELGAHVFAIRCRDVGGETYFDCSIRLTGAGFLLGAVAVG